LGNRSFVTAAAQSEDVVGRFVGAGIDWTFWDTSVFVAGRSTDDNGMGMIGT
jgi:hypothetical protein